MKRSFILLAFFWSISAFATDFYSNCPQALPTNDANFCSSFKSVAECHCIESGLPKKMCQDVEAIYVRMISMFGSVQKACQYQHDTSTRNCIDDWNCYRTGGKDSYGNLCS